MVDLDQSGLGTWRERGIKEEASHTPLSDFILTLFLHLWFFLNIFYYSAHCHCFSSIVFPTCLRIHGECIGWMTIPTIAMAATTKTTAEFLNICPQILSM